jgi:hypothetical protein
MNAQTSSKSYDKFYFSEKYYFPMLHDHQKYEIKSFFTYFQKLQIFGCLMLL